MNEAQESDPYRFAEAPELDEAFDWGAGWVQQARPASTLPEPPESLEAEEKWFGSLSSSALLLSRMLDRVKRDGIALHPGETAGIFLRFHLFSELLQLLEAHDYTWVTALDTYGQPWWDKGQYSVGLSDATPTASFAELAAVCKKHIDALLGAFQRSASAGEVGPVLRGTFKTVCRLAGATEDEIRKNSVR